MRLPPAPKVIAGFLQRRWDAGQEQPGEPQRLRLASRLGSQRGVLFVFDEPSTGLHPLDVATLTGVFDRLLAAGATIIVIDHDLDLLAAADRLIDWATAAAPTAGTSSPQERPRTSRVIRAA
jgi:excinuclease ABC subunit A